MNINVSTIVDVSIAVAANFPARAGFGTLLFLTGETGVLTAPELTRTYNDIDSVTEQWPADSQVVKAATAYFSQTPRPTIFKVGLCEGTETVVVDTPTPVSFTSTDYTSNGTLSGNELTSSATSDANNWATADTDHVIGLGKTIATFTGDVLTGLYGVGVHPQGNTLEVDFIGNGEIVMYADERLRDENGFFYTPPSLVAIDPSSVVTVTVEATATSRILKFEVDGVQIDDEVVLDLTTDYVFHSRARETAVIELLTITNEDPPASVGLDFTTGQNIAGDTGGVTETPPYSFINTLSSLYAVLGANSNTKDGAYYFAIDNTEQGNSPASVVLGIKEQGRSIASATFSSYGATLGNNGGIWHGTGAAASNVQPTGSGYPVAAEMGAVYTVAGASRTLQFTVDGVNEGPLLTLSDNADYLPMVAGSNGVEIEFKESIADHAPVGTTPWYVAPDTAVTTGDLTLCLNNINDFDDDWYGLVLSADMRVSTDSVVAVAEWIEARTKVFGLTTNDVGVLDATVTDDIATQLKNKALRRTMTTYSSSPDQYPSASILARAFTVNFNQPNSTITLMFKSLPGITVEQVSGNTKNIMRSKNVNGFVKVGDKSMYDDSSMANGAFFDELHGLDWLQNAIQTQVCGYLLSRTTKVPYTDKGVAMIEQQVRIVLDEAVRNGLIAPGTTVDGQYLNTGYGIATIPVADINQSDVDRRFYGGLSFTVLGAGAIHRVQINGVFER